MEQIILFIMTYIVVFFIYQVFIVSKAKRRNSKKRPMEVNYLIKKYNIDINKLNYKNLLMTISLVSSLDISIIVTVALLFDNYLLQVIFIFLLVIPVIMISYSFIGKYYKKRGAIKDE